MKNRKLKKPKKLFIFSLIIFFILWIYVYIHDKIKTEVAEITDFKDTLYSSGFVVRDEEVISSRELSDDKYISFTNLENKKIAENSIIAKIYNSYDSSLVLYKIENIIDKINITKKIDLASIFQDEGISTLNQKINKMIEQSICAKTNNKFLDLRNLNQDILYLTSKKSKILGKNNNSSKLISDLENKRNALYSLQDDNVVNITSPSSGELVRYTDGFENLFDCRNLSDIRNLDIENLVPEKVDSKTIGKIIKAETWYVLFNMSEFEAKKLKEYDEIYLNIDNIDCVQNIPCKIESLKNYGGNKNYVLVVSCNIMNENIASLRKENFKICTRSYSGIKIRKNAVHLKHKDSSDMKFGVYIKYGKNLKFKDINIIFSNDDFVICEYGTDYYNNENYLQPGDRVVIQGKKLNIEK